MALADALHGLLRLPGATYACVVERDTGRVLVEAGRGEGGAGDGEGVVPYSVARWGTAVAAMFDSTSGDELDDVMITGRRSYHLVRSLGANATVLAYLRLDRTRSNLAAARRELAAVRWGAGAGGAPRPQAPAPPAAPPAPPARRAPSSSRDAPPRRGRADRGGSAAAGAPAALHRVPASLPPTVTPGRGLRAVGRAPAHPDAAAPVPDPVDSHRIPLPRRSRTRPPPDTPGRRAGPRAVSEVSAAAAAVAPAAAAGLAMPAVLGQEWARDPGTLRRLIAGLRRMS